MKTLKTLQTISKVGRVISKIVFIACIVGFCGCVSGIITVAAGAEGIKFNGVTLKSLLQTEADITTGTLYALMAAGIANFWQYTQVTEMATQGKTAAQIIEYDYNNVVKDWSYWNTQI